MPNQPETDREKRLHEVIAAFLAAIDAGESVNSQDWIDRHEDLNPEFSEFVRDQAEFDQLVLSPNEDANAPGNGKSPVESNTKKATIPSDQSTAKLSQNDLDSAVMEENPWDRKPTFGEYEIVRELGKGGMGVVFEAKQRSLGRSVALKMLRLGALANAEDFQRIRNEAETTATLDHSAIVPIHDVGVHEEQPYFTMKLVHGPPLNQCYESFHQDPRAAAQLVWKLANAVDHAHLRGVLHRDLKPANILIDESGDPHITDFGLSRRIGSDSQLTQTGAIVGTPSFMAPEQASGGREAVTTAVDVYGLGAILYTILAGKPPFRGDTVLATIDQVRTMPPEPPSRMNASVPKDLEAICLKCLEKTRENRYSSAAHVADDLQRFLNKQPILARRPTHWSRFRLWWRRNPIVASLLSIVLVLLLGIVVASNLALAEIRKNYRAAVDAKNDSQRSEGEARSAEQQERNARLAANHHLYESALSQVRAATFDRRKGRRNESLLTIGRVDKKPLTNEQTVLLRNETIACLGLVDVVEEFRHAIPSKLPRANAFDAKIEHYARFDDDRKGITIRRIIDNQVTARLRDIPSTVSRTTPELRFRIDGQFLAAHFRGNRCLVWKLNQPETPLAFPVSEKRAGRGFDFGPNGNQFAVATRDGSVEVYDLDSRKLLQDIQLTKPAVDVRFHPMENRLAVFRDLGIDIYDPNSGQITSRHRSKETAPQELVWTVQGDFLAARSSAAIELFQKGEFPVRRIDLTTRQKESLNVRRSRNLLGMESASSGLCVHPSKWMLANRRSGETVWWCPLRQKSLLSFPEHASAFGTAGERIGLSGDNWIGRGRLKGVREYRVIGGAPSTKLESMQFSTTPDGQFLIANAERNPAWIRNPRPQSSRTQLLLNRSLKTPLQKAPPSYTVRGTATLWNLETNQRHSLFPGQQLPEKKQPSSSRKSSPPIARPPETSRFSRDGTRLYTCEESPTAQSNSTSAFFWRPIVKKSNRLEFGNRTILAEELRSQQKFYPVDIVPLENDLILLKYRMLAEGDALTSPHWSLWDATQEKRIAGSGRKGEVSDVCPSNHLVATVRDRSIEIFDYEQGAVIQNLKILQSQPVAKWSPRGRLLLIGTTHGYRILDGKTWKDRYQLPMDRDFPPAKASAAFSPNEFWIATATVANQVSLCEAKSGRLLGQFTLQHHQPILSVSFSRDNRWLLVASTDGLIHAWNLSLIRHGLKKLALDWMDPHP